MATRKPATKKIKNVISGPKQKQQLVPQEIRDEGERMIVNGLSEALLGFNPATIGAQLSQVDTLFKNNRWYLISNMRQLVSQIYVEHGLIKTLVDVPVDDGMRGGVDIHSKQLSEENLQDLVISVERDNDLVTVAQTGKWDRLFGGAGTVIMTDQDPSTPLNIAAIGPDSPLQFRAVDMWELFFAKQNTSDYAAVMDGPDLIQAEFYDYYGHKLHKSRVMLMTGIVAPSFIRPRLRGWGLSILETLVRSINQYLKATDLVFEILDEFKIDVYKIKNLVNTLMSPQGATKIQERIQLANQQKNYQNAIVMDGEDDYLQKELTFTGIAETMVGIRMQIASDMRMPLTKLFGISAQGFSSGEDDIENYNSMVESQVRNKIKFQILKVLEIKCQKMFGFVPDDLEIEFEPLRILSAEQEENVKTQKFNRLLAAKSASLITDLEFRDSCNRDHLLPVQLDNSEAVLSEIEEIKADDAAAAQGEGGSDAKDESSGKAPKSKLDAPKPKA